MNDDDVAILGLQSKEGRGGISMLMTAEAKVGRDNPYLYTPLRDSLQMPPETPNGKRGTLRMDISQLGDLLRSALKLIVGRPGRMFSKVRAVDTTISQVLLARYHLLDQTGFQGLLCYARVSRLKQPDKVL